MSLPSDRMRELYERRAASEYAAPKPLPDPRLDRKFARIRALVREQLPATAFLDAGCGDGRYFAALAGELPDRVAGVDISERILETARLQAPPGAELRQANLERLPFADAEFDLVLSTQVIEHVLDPALAAAELARVIRPGGVLVLSTDNARNRVSQVLNAPRQLLVRVLRLRHHRSAVHSPATPFTPESFRALLEDAGFGVERIETFRFHLMWPLNRPPVQRLLNRIDERVPAHGWGDVLAAVARKPSEAMPVRFVLRAFSREDDKLCGEWSITGLDHRGLRKLLALNSPLVDSHPVRSEHAHALAAATGHDLDLARWDYVVEADAPD